MPLSATGPVRWSPTRLQAFDDCPFRAYQLYGRGIRLPPSPPAEIGSLTHAVIEDAITQVQQGTLPRPRPGDPDPQVLLALEDAAYQQLPRYHTLSDTDLDDVPAMAYRGLLIVPWQAQLAVEAPGSVDLSPIDTLIGRLDLLAQNGQDAWVIDWKTGWRWKDAAQSLQLESYALMVAAAQPGLPIHVSLRWLRTEKTAHQRIIEPGEIPTLRTQVRDRIAHIRTQLGLVETGVPVAEAFPPTPTSLCSSCPVAVLCPAATPIVGDLATTPDPLTPFPANAPAAEAERYGRLLLSAEAALKSGKEALKAWVTEHGPVTVDDVTWDWQQSHSYSVPDTAQRDELLADAHAAGVPEELLTQVPTTHIESLRKVAKRVKKAHPDLARAILGLIHTAPGSRSFTHKRVDPDAVSPKEDTHEPQEQVTHQYAG